MRLAALGGTGEGTVLNASLCGLLIATDIAMDEKELAVARIDLDSDTQIECGVRVARKYVWDRGCAYGVEVTSITPAHFEQLRSALIAVQRAAAEAASAV